MSLLCFGKGGGGAINITVRAMVSPRLCASLMKLCVRRFFARAGLPRCQQGREEPTVAAWLGCNVHTTAVSRRRLSMRREGFCNRASFFFLSGCRSSMRRRWDSQWVHNTAETSRSASQQMWCTVLAGDDSVGSGSGAPAYSLYSAIPSSRPIASSRSSWSCQGQVGFRGAHLGATSSTRRDCCARRR